MLKLWDVRKVKEDLTCEGEVTSVQIDTSKTVTTPFVDRDSKLLYLISKFRFINSSSLNDISPYAWILISLYSKFKSIPNSLSLTIFVMFSINVLTSKSLNALWSITSIVESVFSIDNSTLNPFKSILPVA